MAYTIENFQVVGRVTPTALTWSTPDAVNGNYFDNAGRKKVLLIQNNGAGNITVTINSNANSDGDLVIPDRTYTIPNDGSIYPFGCYPSSPYHFDDATQGSIRIDWSSSTSVLFAVIDVTPA